MKTIFLSGPIRGLERKDSMGWRQKAEKGLGKKFNVINPLRDREEKGSFPYPGGVVLRDKQGIIESDILLVNDTFTEVGMIGTSMEIIFAFERDKMVIVFGDVHAGNYWMDYHTHIRFSTLKEAVEFINKMLY